MIQSSSGPRPPCGSSPCQADATSAARARLRRCRALLGRPLGRPSGAARALRPSGAQNTEGAWIGMAVTSERYQPRTCCRECASTAMARTARRSLARRGVRRLEVLCGPWPPCTRLVSFARGAFQGSRLVACPPPPPTLQPTRPPVRPPRGLVARRRPAGRPVILKRLEIGGRVCEAGEGFEESKSVPGFGACAVGAPTENGSIGWGVLGYQGCFGNPSNPGGLPGLARLPTQPRLPEGDKPCAQRYASTVQAQYHRSICTVPIG